MRGSVGDGVGAGNSVGTGSDGGSVGPGAPVIGSVGEFDAVVSAGVGAIVGRTS